MENEKILRLLEELRENSDTILRRKVVSMILDECEDEPINYIKDVINNGCASGVVSALIYYTDTKKFFTDNMDDIFNLYNEYCKENDFIPMPSSYYKLNDNNLSWFAFEETTRRIAVELEIEY